MPNAPDERPGGGNASLRLTVFGLAALSLLTAGALLGPELLDAETLAELSRLARSGDPTAIAGFLAISTLAIMFGTPRLIFFSFAGYAFGWGSGFVYATIGCLAGSFLAFTAARWGLREGLSQRFGRHRLLARIVHAEPTILSVALLRFLPISNALVNVGLALSALPVRTFFLGSALGYLPQGMVAVALGSVLANDASTTGLIRIGVAALLLVVLGAVGARLRARLKLKNA